MLAFLGLPRLLGIMPDALSLVLLPWCFSSSHWLSRHVSGDCHLPHHSARGGLMVLGGLSSLFPPPPQREAKKMGPGGRLDHHHFP